MAIKFFKSLSGLSKLFKTTTKSGDSSLSPTTLDNITDIAKNQGVNENSIVHATCSESDATEFGAQYLPGTDVLVVNGSPLVDAKNIVSGISMQVYSGDPVFIAPRGVLKATDVVRVAKIQRTSVGKNGGVDTKGLTIPVWNNTKSVVFGNVTYLPIITLSRLDTTLASDLMEKWRMKVATSTGTTYEINEQELNTILAAQKSSNQMIDYTGTIAFSIWRNGVQVSDWFKWYNDGKILRTEKGLYLPGVQNITYSQLMTKIKTSKLIQGRKYRITDYKPTSAYWNIIPYNTRKTQLIVTAIAKDALDENATLVVNLQPYEVKYSVYRRDHSAGVVYNAQFTCDVAGSNVTMTRVDDLEGISSSLYAIYNDWLGNYSIEAAFKGTLYYGLEETSQEICFALIPYRIDKASVGSQLSIQVVNLAQFMSSQAILTIDSDSWLDEYTGEIYYMRDAYGNEANFDFKGYRYTSQNKPFEYYFPFGGSDDCSESGECQNNKFLNLEQYNRTKSGVKNLTIESYDVVNYVFDASCSGQIYKDAFVKSNGSSSEFLMADGSTLNGINAKATSVAANANPEVTFDNGTFNFKIPSGVNGEKGEKGEKGDTGSVASLTQTEGSVVTSVELKTDKTLTVTRGNIGGRNYLLGSSKVLTSTGDNTANKGYVNIALDFSKDIYKHAGEAAYLSVDIKLENALAAEKVGGSTSTYTRLGLFGKMNQTGNTSEEIYILREISTSTAETLTTRLTKQIAIPEGAISKSYLGLYIQGLKSGTATISNPKLELGSAPTDWSAAPEDLQTSVTSGEYPLLMKGSYIGEGYYDDAVKLNTSTNTISANISGNAATATKATTASKIQEFTKTDLKSGATKSNPGLLYNKGFALLHDYGGTWENMPSGFNYGHVLNLGCGIGTLDTQLAFGYAANISAYIRTADIQSSNIDSTLGIPKGWKDSSNDYGWKRIAWASELSSYLQLSGGTMTGAIQFNRTGDFIQDSSGNTILAIVPDSGGFSNAIAKQLVLGNTIRETNIRGSAYNLKYNNKEVALASDYVKKTGDTMTGNLNITNPSSNPALGVGSSAITYNTTTGCLEITA